MSNKHPVVSPFVADSSRPGQLQQVPLRAPHPSSMVPLMHAPIIPASSGLHPCPPGMPYPTRPLMWHDILLLPPRVAQLCLPAPHACMTPHVPNLTLYPHQLCKIVATFLHHFDSKATSVPQPCHMQTCLQNSHKIATKNRQMSTLMWADTPILHCKN